MRTQWRMPVQNTSRPSTSITSCFKSDGSNIIAHKSLSRESNTTSHVVDLLLLLTYQFLRMGQSLSSSTHRSDPSQPRSGCPSQRGCPVDHSSAPLNPLNQMPSLPQTPLDNSNQLPTERTLSSIPRTLDATRKETWEYPSPQQFYNALVRKGWETPVEHVETMVEIHNFLNERAWGEVLKWEMRVAQ